MAIKRRWSVGVLLALCAFTASVDPDFDMIRRGDWGAQPPTSIEKMTNPVPYVIIYHSYRPPACYNTDDCKAAMLVMQKYHMVIKGWDDIGYSFAVGGDGKVYEGSGWSTVGAHSTYYNNRSIGICAIGDWRNELPPQNQLDAIRKLIAYGVKNGKIERNYILYGHRQVSDTESPGNRMFQEITTWDHFSKKVKKNVPEMN